MRWLAVRHFARHKLRTALALMSVALGVSTFVSMSALNRNTLAAYAETARARAGDADLVARGTLAGLDASLLDQLESVDGVRRAVPLVLRFCTARRSSEEPAERFVFLGVDPQRPPGAEQVTLEQLVEEIAAPWELLSTKHPVFVNAPWARRHQVKVGDSWEFDAPAGAIALPISGILRADSIPVAMGSAVAMSPLASAQELFGSGDRIDRILIRLEENQDKEALLARLQALVGDQAHLSDPLQEAREFDAVLGSVRLALRLLSLLSLLIAAFLVHSTISMALTERRRELAILRCVGMPARSVRTMLLREALLLGGVGGSLGVVLGFAVAGSMTDLFWNTIGTTFDRIDAVASPLHPADAIIGLLAGPLAAAMAALGPARRAAQRAPLQGLRLERTPPAPSRAARDRRVSVGLAILAIALVNIEALHFPRSGYLVFVISIAALVFGGYPWMRLAMSRTGPWFLRVMGPGGRLARDHLDRAHGNTSSTLVAVSLGFGMVFSTHVLVRSFESLLEHWFDRTIQEDLFVMGEGFLASGLQGTDFDLSLRDEFRAVDGVSHVHGLRFNRIPYRNERVLLFSLDAAAPEDSGQFLYVEGGPADKAAWAKGDGIFVSEGLAFLQGVHRGDSMELPTPGGIRELPILAVVQDYTWPRGVVLIDDDLYQDLYDDFRAHEFAITLNSSRSLDSVQADIERILGDRYHAFVLTQEQVQSSVFSVFHDYWSLLLAQETLAVLVAALGTFHTLLISVLLRRREIGLLRAVGAPRQVLRRMIQLEGALIGLGGGALGVLFGGAISAVTLRVLCLEEQGYRCPWEFSWWVVAAVLVGAAATGWLAAWLPSRTAEQTEVLSVIGEE